MKFNSIVYEFRSGIGAISVFLILFSCKVESSPSIIGKWKSTKAWASDNTTIEPGEIVYEFKKDSTYDGYEDGKLAVKNKRFSITQRKRPLGNDMVHFLDLGNRPAKEELGEGHLDTPTIIYFKKGTNDTMLLVTLSPYNGYREEVFSEFYKIK